MQQLAAAPPKAMGQRPELKFINEQGQKTQRERGAVGFGWMQDGSFACDGATRGRRLSFT